MIIDSAAAQEICDRTWFRGSSMIIWRGKGILVAVIAFVCLLLAELATRLMFGDETYYQNHGWPKLVGFWVAAGLVYAMRSWLGGGPARILIDEEHEKEIKLPAEGALFFVPVRYWPVVLLGLGVAFYFVRG
jgi:hypothetical protein